MAKNHRTALVIDTSQGFAGNFRERARRLLESVGGPNIKTDVYTWDGSQLVEGAPGSAPAAASTSLDEQIAALGYDQVVVSKPGRADVAAAAAASGSLRSPRRDSVYEREVGSERYDRVDD